MILTQTPMTLTFWGQQQLNISTTIYLGNVASVQLFQRGVEKQWTPPHRYHPEFREYSITALNARAIPSWTCRAIKTNRAYLAFVSRVARTRATPERIFRSTQTTEIPTLPFIWRKIEFQHNNSIFQLWRYWPTGKDTIVDMCKTSRAISLRTASHHMHTGITIP